MGGRRIEAIPTGGLLAGFLALAAFAAALMLIGAERAEATSISAPPYIVKDSNEPAGPDVPAPGAFVDISLTGTRVTFFDADALPAQNQNADDGVALAIAIPFENGAGFDFYGNRFTAVNMSTNGFLHFDLNGSSDSLSNNCPVQNAAAPNNIIAPLWDDLVLRNPPSTIAGGYVQTFGTAPNRVMIFQWDNVDHFGGLIDSFDFEAKLFETSNAIEFAYPTPLGNPEAGSGSTSGIENATAGNSANYACDTNNSITPGLGVRFSRPTLDVTRAGSGQGSVAGAVTADGPGGPVPPDQAINCPPACSDFFDLGSDVTLTPTAVQGSVFTGFSGACTGTGPCVIDMDSSKAVTANFADRPSLGVALSGTGKGSVVSSPAGIDCGTTCTTEVDPGTSVTLTPKPNQADGSTFGGFSGACTGTGPCVINMDSDKTVAATFNADSAVELDLSGSAKQKLAKLAVEAGCGTEACDVVASGAVSAKAAKKGRRGPVRRAKAKAKTFKLASSSASSAAGKTVTLALKVKGKKSARKLASLLKNGAKATAAIDVKAIDARGNTTTKSLAVKLKR